MEMHTTSGNWRLGIILSLGTALLWGVGPIALKAVLAVMDPYTISFYRFLISAVLLGLIVLPRRGRPSLAGLGRRTLILLVVAALSLASNYAVFLLALDRLTPGTAVVVIQTAPMFLLFGGILFFKERYTRRQFLGLAVLISGLALFFNQRLIELFTSLGEFTVGIVLIILAALLWACYALSQKQLLKSLPSETIMLVVYTGGVLFFIPLSHPVRLLDLGAVETALLVFTGLVTIVSYGAFSEALDHLEASRISAVLATIPLITLASSRAVSGLFPQYLEPEHLNLLTVAGALMVAAGSMISSLSRSPLPEKRRSTTAGSLRPPD